MNNILKKNNNLTSILKGFIISLILTIIFIWIYALLLVKTNIQESTIAPVVITISGISVLIGSSIACLHIKKNGILNGACIGGMYYAVIYVLSSIALCGFAINVKSLIMIVIGVLLGGIGGIIGVNIGK